MLEASIRQAGARMCGLVAGLLANALQPQQLERALRSLHHRGPDASGQWIAADGRSFLGHTRLSIIGLDNGDQPISDSGGQVHLIVNGEFYGYQAIRKALQLEGARFSTDSDSEIALHLYLRQGLEMARQLRGEFAAVIADERSRTLLAIRDRFGIKPLFYAVHQGSVYFASEVKALLALGVPARWDYEAMLADAYQARLHSRSLFAGIRMVPPGCYALARDGAVQLRPYWDLSFPAAATLEADRRSDEEVVQGFRQVLDDAVRERLIADVEVAAYLSGGIDSCAVLGLAQRHLARPIRAFTLSFDDALYDESALAQAQAERSGATYHPIAATRQALAEAYSEAVWHAETTFFNGHGVAKFLLSRGVRDAGIKVVFTGEGADEMLGGYAPFRRDVLLYNSARQNPETVARLLAAMRATNKAVPMLIVDEGRPRCAALGAIERRLGWIPSWMLVWSAMGDGLVGHFTDRQLAGRNPYDSALRELDFDALAGRDPLNQALYLWAKTALPNFILTLLGDRMEMAHSIEGRVPFLDHHVAEYAAGIPIHLKINGLREKHVLREAARDVLIEPVYNREKHPFSAPPLKPVEDDPLRELFGDVLASSALDAQPVFDPAAARNLYRGYAELPPEVRMPADALLHRIVSATLLHQRFGMSA
jgi:asparagine synthase (glutamine-hydrolysing)